MFRRLFFEHWVSIFTLIAFITSVSFYISFTWRALRMKRPQIDRLSHLPFDDRELPVKEDRRHDA